MLFNGIGSVLSASWMGHYAEQFADENAMLICTGSKLKWISTDAYFNYNKVVFIDPPEQAPEQVEDIDCANVFISDKHIAKIAKFPVFTDFLAHQAFTSRLQQRPYTAYPYRSAHSRAPPQRSV